MECRNCAKNLNFEFVNLFTAPPSNSFLKETQLAEGEMYYPLKVMVCDSCYLVQLDEYKKSNEIFNSDYIYFSSISQSWLLHARKYVDEVINRFHLSSSSFVVEVASNDGYLLQNFKEKGIPCLGVEPTAGTAKAADDLGIQTIVKFFGKQTALEIVKEYGKADLALGNNVLAHVPNIHDFVQGYKVLLKDEGIATFEFPHLVRLVEELQFDTIYHEHFSYLSLYSVEKVLQVNGLRIFDAEEITTHGGSLRIFVCHEGASVKESTRLHKLRNDEINIGINQLKYYEQFASKIVRIKEEALDFLLIAKKTNKKVVAFGAAAKGNTFFNYCGIKSDLVQLIGDSSPYKQGTYLPGSRIPVVTFEALKDFEPDYVLIMPWNLKAEIYNQLIEKGFKGSKFVTFIPRLRIM